jgi:hypothetical protein
MTEKERKVVKFWPFGRKSEQSTHQSQTAAKGSLWRQYWGDDAPAADPLMSSSSTAPDLFTEINPEHVDTLFNRLESILELPPESPSAPSTGVVAEHLDPDIFITGFDSTPSTEKVTVDDDILKTLFPDDMTQTTPPLAAAYNLADPHSGHEHPETLMPEAMNDSLQAELNDVTAFQSGLMSPKIQVIQPPEQDAAAPIELSLPDDDDFMGNSLQPLNSASFTDEAEVDPIDLSMLLPSDDNSESVTPIHLPHDAAQTEEHSQEWLEHLLVEAEASGMLSSTETTASLQTDLPEAALLQTEHALSDEDEVLSLTTEDLALLDEMLPTQSSAAWSDDDDDAFLLASSSDESQLAPVCDAVSDLALFAGTVPAQCELPEAPQHSLAILENNPATTVPFCEDVTELALFDGVVPTACQVSTELALTPQDDENTNFTGTDDLAEHYCLDSQPVATHSLPLPPDALPTQPVLEDATPDTMQPEPVLSQQPASLSDSGNPYTWVSSVSSELFDFQQLEENMLLQEARRVNAQINSLVNHYFADNPGPRRA